MKLKHILFITVMSLSLSGCFLTGGALKDDVRERCVEIEQERACDVAAMKGMLGWLMHNVNNATVTTLITKQQNEQVYNLVQYGHKLANSYKAGATNTESLANVLDEIILLMVQWGVETTPPTPEQAIRLDPVQLAARSMQLRQGG